MYVQFSQVEPGVMSGAHVNLTDFLLVDVRIGYMYTYYVVRFENGQSY